MPHNMTDEELLNWTFKIRFDRNDFEKTKSKFKKKKQEDKELDLPNRTKLTLNDGKLLIG